MDHYAMPPHQPKRSRQPYGEFRCMGCGSTKRVKNPVTGISFSRLQRCFTYGHRACGPRRFERVPCVSNFVITLPAPPGSLHADYFGRA